LLQKHNLSKQRSNHILETLQIPKMSLEHEFVIWVATVPNLDSLTIL